MVTGIYSRKKRVSRGLLKRIKRKIEMIGNQNILQSLKAPDPAFNIMKTINTV